MDKICNNHGVCSCEENGQELTTSCNCNSGWDGPTCACEKPNNQTTEHIPKSCKDLNGVSTFSYANALSCLNLTYIYDICSKNASEKVNVTATKTDGNAIANQVMKENFVNSKRAKIFVKDLRPVFLPKLPKIFKCLMTNSKPNVK